MHATPDPQSLLSRRAFIKTTTRALGAAGLVLGTPAGRLAAPPRLDPDQAPVARYWVAANAAGVDCRVCHGAADAVSGDVFRHAGQPVRCQLCAQECLLDEGQRGRCRARINVHGRLRSLVYGRPVSVHVDPIEKKPFYHFLPGSQALSLATAGCPLTCKFCQNWEISQARPEDFDTRFVPPARVVQSAVHRQVPVIAFTYNEPTVFVEYLTDIARLGAARARHAVLISCGLMTAAPLQEMCRVLSAIKIDLKGFSRDFYRTVCGAELAPVLRSIVQVRRSGVHLEIVNLVVPTLNDSEAMLTALARWVRTELGPDVPVHFTRFHPDYQMRHLPPTPVATLERAYAIARAEGLHYPYVGNVPGHAGNHTCCPACGQVVVQRSGFFVTALALEQGRCRFCGSPVAGVWSDPRAPA